MQPILHLLEFAMPLIRGLSVAKRLRILGVAILFYLLATATAVYVNNREAGHSARYTAKTGNLQVALHKIIHDVQLGLSGNVKGFDDLQKSAGEFSDIISLLDKGDAELPPTGGDARVILNDLISLSSGMMSNVESTLNGRQVLQTLGNSIAAIDKTGKDVRVVTQQMIDNYQGEQKLAATQLALAIERIAKDTNQMLISDITLDQLAQLGIYTFASEDALKLLPTHDPLVQEAMQLFDPYRTSIETLVGHAHNLVDTNAAAYSGPQI